MEEKLEQPGQDLAPGLGMKFGRDLTTGSIPRHLIMFSLPMLAGSALQTAYSFINAIWVGQYLGREALAAISNSFPVVFVMIALGAGLTMATSILISQHFGARDMAAVRRVVDTSTILMTVLGLILLVVGEVFTPHILRLMHTPADVMELTAQYLRVFLLSLPLGFGLFLTRSMLQGVGDSKTPLYFQTGAVLLNTALDPVLMFGWLGLPALGLNGTAWASVISQLAGLWALVATLQRRKNPVAPGWSLRRFDWRTTWTILYVGVPSAVQQSLISIGMMFVIGIINGFGTVAAAAFGVASRVDQLAFMPAMTFSMAISTLAGQNIGANRHHRIREILLWGCLLSGGITVLASILAVSLPRLLLHIFTSDEPVVELGISYLRIVGASYLLFAIMFVTNGIINGSGHTLVTMVIPILSLWIVRLPLAVWLSRHLGSIDGVWYAIALSFGVSMVVSMAYYLTGLWRKPVVRRQPAAPANEAAAFGEEVGEA